MMSIFYRPVVPYLLMFTAVHMLVACLALTIDTPGAGERVDGRRSAAMGEADKRETEVVIHTGVRKAGGRRKGCVRGVYC